MFSSPPFPRPLPFHHQQHSQPHKERKNRLLGVDEIHGHHQNRHNPKRMAPPGTGAEIVQHQDHRRQVNDIIQDCGRKRIISDIGKDIDP